MDLNNAEVTQVRIEARAGCLLDEAFTDALNIVAATKAPVIVEHNERRYLVRHVIKELPDEKP